MIKLEMTEGNETP